MKYLCACFLWLWSVFILLTFFFFRLLSPFSSRIKRFFTDKRKPSYFPLIKSPSVLFFVSSAGEYEQAKTLITRLYQAGLTPILCFFSPSGYDFATKRKESNFFFLSPADTIFAWSQIFAKLPQIKAAVVIRHELWPSFLFTAKKLAIPLYLINATLNKKELKNKKLNFLKQQLLSTFKAVYACDEASFQIIKSYRLVTLTSDTKYDRVFERRLENSTELSGLKAKLATIMQKTYRFAIGSSWPEDLALVLPAYKKLLTQNPNSQIILFLANHEVTSESTQKTIATCQQFGFNTSLLSNLLENQSQASLDILIIDQIGILAEIYGLCQAAFIGGSVARKIHNILEPASYNLALSFGRSYENSPEAKHLASQGLAKVITSSEDLYCHWQEEMTHDFKGGQSIERAMAHLRGASDFLCQEILGQPPHR